MTCQQACRTSGQHGCHTWGKLAAHSPDCLLSLVKISLWLTYKTAIWHMHKEYMMADHSEGIYLHEWGGEGYSGEAPRSWPVSCCEWRLMCCEMAAIMYHARTMYLFLRPPLLPSAFFSWTDTALNDDMLQGIKSLLLPPPPQNEGGSSGK